MPGGNATIPRHALLACEPFGTRLAAARVADAIAGGLAAAGAPTPDALALPAPATGRADGAALERASFHERMLAARALVIVVAELSERTLAGSQAFELATRARQSGVPCYAVAATVELDAFDLRVLDLQLVLRARGERTLHRAGERLAEVI